MRVQRLQHVRTETPELDFTQRAIAAGAAPIVLAGLDYISGTIGSRRVDHATEALTDGAEEFGTGTAEEFVEFVKAAVSDEERQELWSEWVGQPEKRTVGVRPRP